MNFVAKIIIISYAINQFITERRMSFLKCSTCFNPTNKIKTPVRTMAVRTGHVCEMSFCLIKHIRFHLNVKLI